LRLQAVGRVRQVSEALPLLPLIDRLASTDALSELAAISARTAGVVRAFLCKAIRIIGSRYVESALQARAIHLAP